MNMKHATVGAIALIMVGSCAPRSAPPQPVVEPGPAFGDRVQREAERQDALERWPGSREPQPRAVTVGFVSTDGDIRQTRVCTDAGQHVVVAEAGSLEVAATATLYRDDGSTAGEFVAAAIRFRGMPRQFRSEPVDLDAECYSLTALTGVEGSRVTARLLALP